MEEIEYSELKYASSPPFKNLLQVLRKQVDYIKNLINQYQN